MSTSRIKKFHVDSKPRTAEAIMFNGRNEGEVRKFVGCYGDDSFVEGARMYFTYCTYRMSVGIGEYLVKERGGLKCLGPELFAELFDTDTIRKER